MSEEQPRVLAVGDIHGCFAAFCTLWGMISPTANDTVVILGDFVDSGPASRRVIERLISLEQATHLVTLKGNHEELMLSAKDGFSNIGTWMNFGGDRTLASYAQPGHGYDLLEIPEDHWRFLHACIDYYETDTHIFVHGMAAPHQTLAKQDGKVLRWSLFESASPHVSGKVIVCGHTRQRSGLPINKGFAICIDTNASDGGWLTCLEVNNGTVWQAKEGGEQRAFTLANMSEQS